jgi:hypothetical protein
MSRPRWAALAVTGVVLLPLFFLWMRRPVMIRLWAGPMRGDRKVTVLGPLRNRGPEVAAVEFLNGIRDGRCQELLGQLAASANDAQAQCADESFDPLRDWRLINRQDEPGASLMTFEWASSKQGFSHHEWLEIRALDQHGSWRVATYGRVF